MRDNHKGLPEILGLIEREGHRFGVVQVVLDLRPHAFEFGIADDASKSLRSVLQCKPFGGPDLGSYRYFFVPSVSRHSPGRDEVEFAVRIEQGREGRSFRFSGPRSLVANLMWFFELKTPSAAGHLRRAESRLNGRGDR